MNLDKIIDECYRTRTDRDYRNILEDRALDRYIVLNVLHTFATDQGYSNLEHLLRNLNQLPPTHTRLKPDTGQRTRKGEQDNGKAR